jgi:glutamate-1-semialdehyde 2,1-aminomutase
LTLPESAIAQRYRARTPRSAEAAGRAGRVLAGGNTRQAAWWPPYPLTIERAEGSLLWDLDGNRYIDVVNNYTALVHGHAYPPVTRAVEAQLRQGVCWPAGVRAQAALAELIVERVPSVEQLRFTNSGTEAAGLALTIARTLTGRDKVLMARHGYHGGLLEFESGHRGQPWRLTLLGEYNDAASFAAVLAARGDEIAAVFLEPMLGAGGVIPATRGFLEAVCAATRRAGALFVLDEVQSFRLATGGLQAELGLTPDLTLFGKLIGGGFPIGAVGGPRALLEAFEPGEARIFHSGTFNGNPIAMTAGEVTLRELTGARIGRMAALAARLGDGLMAAARTAGVEAAVNRVGSIMNLYLGGGGRGASGHREASGLMRELHLAALNHGVFLAPRGLMALSTVQDEALIDAVADRMAAAFQDLAAARSRG